MPIGFFPLLLNYGYGLVFILILLESAGFPLPGETMFVLAAAYAATGHLSIQGVILSAALGAIVGDMGGYWIGRGSGGAILARVSGRHYEKHLQRGRVFFGRYGPGAVFLARFVPVVRVVSANLAGITNMNFKTFSLFNAAGGIVWALLTGGAGYLFGNNLPQLEAILRRIGFGAAAGVGLVVFIIWVGRIIFNKRSPRCHNSGEEIERKPTIG